VALSLVVLTALFLGFLIIAYIALLFNRERYQK
jgi:phage shock protein PspC (stress-responsive transcriptional regulator)